MLRILAIAAMLAFAVPSLGLAEEHHEEHHPPGKPGGGPPPKGPPHGPPPGGHQFSYHGKMFNPVHGPAFVYPRGWEYRRWVVGGVLPPLFLVPAYYYAEWAALGLAAPEPGFQWVRYGPDLLLVNVTTGQVVEVVYGVIY